MPEPTSSNPGILLSLDALRADADGLQDQCFAVAESLTGLPLHYLAAAAQSLGLVLDGINAAKAAAERELRKAAPDHSGPVNYGGAIACDLSRKGG